MSRWHSYLHTAVTILGQYKGEEPFASFLKKYFAVHKKSGSTDRKQISQLCYGYFRLGKAELMLPAEERILLGLFLVSAGPHPLLEALKPEWNDKTGLPYEEKSAATGNSVDLTSIFPWKDELGEEIDQEKFGASFLVQPDLFLRCRPGQEKTVQQKLSVAGIPFYTPRENCIGIANNTKTDTVIALDREAVVQDYSSQRVGELLQRVRNESAGPLKVWDCCAASGGKSILAKDILVDIALTVSDVRESILHNLKNRFREAGIGHYKSFTTDLTGNQQPATGNFDLIIADVPCSGSGTWSRTPEQLFYFNTARISVYAALQKKIIANSVVPLKPGGFYLYITCSVFKKENEEAVKFIQQEFTLEPVKIGLLEGYTRKADTLFAALFRKPL